MNLLSIPVQTTGAFPRRAFDLYDTYADTLDFEEAVFAWAGCIDAASEQPAGSCVPDGWQFFGKPVSITTRVKRP